MESSPKVLQKRKNIAFSISKSPQSSGVGQLFIRCLARFRNAGVAGDRKGQSILGIRFMNSSSLIAASLVFFFGISLSIISGQYIILYIGIPETVLFCLVIWLNSKQRNTTATLAWEVTFCSATLIYGVLLRDVIDAITMLPFLVGAPWLVLIGAENRRKILPICLGFAICTLIGMELMKAVNLIAALPLSEFYWYFRPATAFTVLFLDIIVVWTVFKEYNGLLTKLTRSTRRSIRASKLAKDFASSTTHELKSPLDTLQGIAEQIGDPKIKREELQELAETTRSCVTHMAAVVSNVQVLSILDAGKRPALEYEYIDIRSFLNSLVAYFGIETQNRKIGIFLEMDNQLPKVVYAARTPLNQILTNLLSNAIKFSNPGGEVIIKTMYEDTRVVFIVRDYGLGIPASHIGKIFRKFFTTTFQNSKGTGLGLYITRSLVQILGGKITVSSVVGYGSEFTVSLPIMKPISANKPENEEMSVLDVKVMVVDDNSLLAKTLSGMLEKKGCISRHCSTAIEAIRLAKRFLPHMILIDLNLAEGAGSSLKVIEGIKMIPELSETLIVYMSGDMLTNEQLTKLKSNQAEFLHKPIHPNSLQHIISSLRHQVV